MVWALNLLLKNWENLFCSLNFGCSSGHTAYSRSSHASGPVIAFNSPFSQLISQVHADHFAQGGLTASKKFVDKDIIQYLEKYQNKHINKYKNTSTKTSASTSTKTKYIKKYILQHLSQVQHFAPLPLHSNAALTPPSRSSHTASSDLSRFSPRFDWIFPLRCQHTAAMQQQCSSDAAERSPHAALTPPSCSPHAATRS